uniref:(northern house mosquito) hypothetical protein n=1 Tax=Culex pipiens TaxID=7175 RepID=A0A8D8H8D7_CULPI
MCPLSAPPPFRIGDLWGFGGGGGGMLLAGTGDSMANEGNRRTGKMFYLYICKGKWVAKKMERRILKMNFTVSFGVTTVWHGSLWFLNTFVGDGDPLSEHRLTIWMRCMFTPIKEGSLLRVVRHWLKATQIQAANSSFSCFPRPDLGNR